jgi:hypothetical protein
MKKIILMLIAIVTLSVFSISESNAQFSMGLRVGFNASKYTGLPGSKFAPGIHIGPYFRLAVKEKYRIQADLLFSTKGQVHKDSLTGATELEKYYNMPFYLDIPIMFNYKPIAGLYIEAGVQPSILLTQLNFSTNTESKFNSAGLQTIDFAPIAGIGYELKKVSLGIRGSFGVTNVSSFSGISPKTMSLMATFGFKFL